MYRRYTQPLILYNVCTQFRCYHITVSLFDRRSIHTSQLCEFFIEMKTKESHLYVYGVRGIPQKIR